jgi:PAS domain S-box-containing protein
MSALCRLGHLRSAAAGWAVAASVLCAVGLWYHASTIADHQSELHKIINYAPDAVIVCNSRGQVLYANDAVRVITGFTEEDLIRGGVEQVIPLPLRVAHRTALSRATTKSERGIEGVNYRRVYPVSRKDGTMILCLISVGSVQHSDGPQFFAFIAPVGDATEEPKAAPGSTAQNEP